MRGRRDPEAILAERPHLDSAGRDERSAGSHTARDAAPRPYPPKWRCRGG
jgi:hypothetical protein